MKINNVYKKDVIDFLRDVKKESIDLIIADPPYNQKIDDWDNFKTEKKYFDFMYSWLDLAIDTLKITGSIYLFNNSYNSAFIMKYLLDKGMKFQNSIIWYKKDGFSVSKRKYVNNQETILFFTKSQKHTFNYEDIRIEYSSKDRIYSASKKGILKNGKRWFPNPKGKLCTDVWEIPSYRLTNKVNGKTTKTIHPTPKPELMIERIIKASSNENDIVLDLFSGSGTTSIVAYKTKRNFIACESNEIFFNYIKNKLKNLEK